MAKKKKSAKKSEAKKAEIKEKPKKHEKGLLEKAVGLLAWLTGVIVSLAVGFGMTSETLTVPKIQVVVPFFGWVVIITTLLSVVLAIIHRLQK